MPTRDRQYIEACLKETLRWIEENDNLPESSIDFGVWYSDLRRAEVLCFVEDPSYADEFSDPEEFKAYQLILVPVEVDED